MKNKAKTFMIFGISLLVFAVIGSTFAYYVWRTSSDQETKIVTNIGAATVYFNGGASIENAKLRPVSDKSKGIVKTIEARANTSGVAIRINVSDISVTSRSAMGVRLMRTSEEERIVAITKISASDEEKDEQLVLDSGIESTDGNSGEPLSLEDTSLDRLVEEATKNIEDDSDIDE